MKLAQMLMEELRRLDPEIEGSISVHEHKGVLNVDGQLHTSHDADELLRKAFGKIAPTKSLPVTFALSKIGLQVMAANDTATLGQAEEWDSRHAKVLYAGLMQRSRITAGKQYKRENWQTKDKIGNCVEELGFLAPLVLDRHLNVIDGELRLALAEEINRERVQVVVLDVEGAKASFLRLILNRSSEFQKWRHDEVDEFVDAWPQLQPLLEPLGFFGERVLPVSYFGDTILAYKLDEFHTQQLQYRQEMGLARWAEIQRERVEKKEEQRRRKRKITPSAGLFELPSPEESDFLPTYDIVEEKRQFIADAKDMAETITNNYDDKMRAEKEARGQQWQNSRRGTKQVTRDRRAEAQLAAEAEFNENLGDELNIDD